MFRKLRAEAERENGEENRLMFDNRALFALLLPIIIEHGNGGYRYGQQCRQCGDFGGIAGGFYQ
jgi:hypothetical protein